MKAVDSALVARLATEHGTPYYLYDAGAMRERVDSLRAFDVIRYAQKACSNVHVLRLLREAGCVVDAVSLGEVERAVRAGFDGRGEPALSDQDAGPCFSGSSYLGQRRIR